jgi:hypothetical protein
MTKLKPGTTVKDKEGKENFGLQMNVVDEAQQQVKVSYQDPDGQYKEGWLHKERILVIEADEHLPLNPALY